VNKSERIGVVGFAVAAIVSGCSPNGFLGSGSSDPTANPALMAKLVEANGAEGWVEFNEEADHRELTVGFSGGEPGATIDLTINGVVVFSFTLDEFGGGHFELDSDPDEPGEDSLPAEFTGVNEGDEVQAGDLLGTFNQHDDGDANDLDDGQADDIDDGDVGDNDDQVDDMDEEDLEDSHDGNSDDVDDSGLEDDGQVDDGESDDTDHGPVDDTDDGNVDG